VTIDRALMNAEVWHRLHAFDPKQVIIQSDSDCYVIDSN